MLLQQSHPTHVVAGAGIVWRTSAHKGSPLFHRRAPAPITVNPERSPGASHDDTAAKYQGTHRRRREYQRSRESARSDSSKSILPASAAVSGVTRRDAHTVAEEFARWESREGYGINAMQPGRSAKHMGFWAFQDALGALRRLRGALRLGVAESTGNVPLHSG